MEKKISTESEKEFTKASLRVGAVQLGVLALLSRDSNKQQIYAMLCYAIACIVEGKKTYATFEAQEFLAGHNLNSPFKNIDGTQTEGILDYKNGKLSLSGNLDIKYPIITGLGNCEFDQKTFKEIVNLIKFTFTIKPADMTRIINSINKSLTTTKCMSDQEIVELKECIEEVNKKTDILIAIKKANDDEQKKLEQKANRKAKEIKGIAKNAEKKAAKQRADEQAAKQKVKEQEEMCVTDDDESDEV
jgi:hypothetical protein